MSNCFLERTGMSGSKGTSHRRVLHAYVCLMRAAESVSRRSHHHLDEDDLTSSQFGVLEALLHLGPLSQCELAQKLLKSTGNMTTVIDNLERRGLVERQPDNTDRRIKAIHLTPEGRALIRRVFPRHAEGLVRELSVLSRSEQDELARLCKKLGLGRGA